MFLISLTWWYPLLAAEHVTHDRIYRNEIVWTAWSDHFRVEMINSGELCYRQWHRSLFGTAAKSDINFHVFAGWHWHLTQNHGSSFAPLAVCRGATVALWAISAVKVRVQNVSSIAVHLFRVNIFISDTDYRLPRVTVRRRFCVWTVSDFEEGRG
jgi:hypothetical protein